MKRFLGIFAAALLFLFLFTFFGGSYFLDIQHHFYAWMFPVSLGIAFVIWAFWRLDDKVEALQKQDGRAGSRPAENRRSQIKKQSSTQRRLCGAFSYSILGNNSEAPAFLYTHLLFRSAQTCPACQWLSLWESCHRR